MQLSSAELIVTIVSAIVGLLMGFVSGAMPLQPQRMTPVQATVQKVLGFAIVAVVVVLALASMNVAMWTTLIAVALGIAIANVPVIRRDHADRVVRAQTRLQAQQASPSLTADTRRAVAGRAFSYGWGQTAA